jgi:hypothetical protein
MKTKQAFTIAETLVTLLVVTLMIAGPVSFIAKSFSYSAFVKNKTIAVGLSQEGLELATSLRNISRSNFTSLAAACSSGCAIDWNGESSEPSLVPCDGKSCILNKVKTGDITTYKTIGTDESIFYRQLIFTPTDTANVYSVVSRVYTDDALKVDVQLKKTLFAIDIKSGYGE